jgi:predicted exporter
LSSAGDVPSRLDRIGEGLGFQTGAFSPFTEKILQTIRSEELVIADTYSGTELEGLVHAGLYYEAEEWVSFLTLFDVKDPTVLKEKLREAFPSALFIDLKDASLSMMRGYRIRVVEMLLLALLLILAYLVFTFGFTRKLLWVVGTLTATQLSTLGITGFIVEELSIFNLIACVLVAGLGLDYTIFFARDEASDNARKNTKHAVSICALSTWVAFTILAFSSIPVLHSIGVTVSVGVASGYLLAYFGRQLAA